MFLEGFTPNVVGSAKPSFSPSSTFNNVNIPGLMISGPTVSYDLGGIGTAYENVEQRIRFAYEIDFTSASLGSPTAFPAGGAAPNAYTLGASISITGQPTLNCRTPRSSCWPVTIHTSPTLMQPQVLYLSST